MITEEIKASRKMIDNSILYEKRKNIINKIKQINPKLEFDYWINSNILLYVAPIKKIGTLACIYEGDGFDVYIDESFAENKNNKEVIVHQLTHELLHILCREQRNSRGHIKQFGHDWYYNDSMLLGLDEATTQLFADDIENDILSKEHDPNFFFIKNIMRILKVIIGEEKLMMQYLNFNNDFEEAFNSLTNNQFDDFANMMNKIYKLNMKIKIEDNNINYGQIETTLLENLQNDMAKMMKNLISLSIQRNPDLKVLLENEFMGNEFNLNDYIKSDTKTIEKKGIENKSLRKKLLMIKKQIIKSINKENINEELDNSLDDKDESKKI